MRYHTLILLTLISFYISSCGSSDLAEKKEINYSFFVAGHTYGNPMHYQYGLHPPFVEAIPFINDYPEMSLGFLTGDIVSKPTRAYWDSAIVDMNKFNFPLHIAPGNHDRGIEFLKSFKKFYYEFDYQGDLFILLSPSNWNIKGEEKDFLFKTLDEKSDSVENIFIFCHELIWWSPENKFKNVEINYRPHYPGSSNYWEELSPKLESLPNKVIIFAGDLGCTKVVSPYMYYNYKNITLIGSGMGGGEQDNIVIVEVDNNHKVKYKLMGINKKPIGEMAKLEDYILP